MIFSEVLPDLKRAKEFIELNKLDKTADEHFIIVVWVEKWQGEE